MEPVTKLTLSSNVFAKVLQTVLLQVFSLYTVLSVGISHKANRDLVSAMTVLTTDQWK